MIRRRPSICEGVSVVFGFDRLVRQFALDLGRVEAGQPLVVRLLRRVEQDEPGLDPDGALGCAGCRVPLFLLDVYWSLSGQMRLQVIGRPPGTAVRGVAIEE